MQMSAATGGFRLAYDRSGDGPPVLALHGWPGARVDYREVVPRLTGYDVVVPDLRGFGESDKHRSDPAAAYSAAAQAASVIALIEELLLTEVVIAGYDIGSRIGQVVAAARPGLLRTRGCAAAAGRRRTGPGRRGAARVLVPVFSPARPGRAACRWPARRRARLPGALLVALVGPSFELGDAALDRLVEHYAPPGAFVASISW